MAAWPLHGVCFGEEGGARNLAFFPCKVAAAGEERHLLCAAVAAGVVSRSNRFSCVVLCAGWLSGCRSQCNGCMIVVTFCCHVRRDMHVL